MPAPVASTPPSHSCACSCSLARKASPPRLRPAAMPPRQWCSSTTSPEAPAAARSAMLARRRPMACCTVIATSPTCAGVGWPARPSTATIIGSKPSARGK
eukprot:10138182-Alexandrium_andersonii.AAC.1